MKKIKAKLVVVMPAHNAKKNLLLQAVNSVLTQTYSNFILLIADDASDYDVHDFLQKHFSDKRLLVIRNKHNLGLAKTLNQLIANNLDCEFVARMDADDSTDKNRLKETLAFLQRHPQYDVTSVLAAEFNDDDSGGRTFTVGTAGQLSAKQLMRTHTFIVHAAVMMRRSAFLAVGGYDEEYKRSEDLSLWCKMLINNSQFYVLNKVMYNYRVNNADYKKRSLLTRLENLKIRFKYYPKLRANLIDYLYLSRFIVAGILPVALIKLIKRAAATR